MSLARQCKANSQFSHTRLLWNASQFYIQLVYIATVSSNQILNFYSYLEVKKYIFLLFMVSNFLVRTVRYFQNMKNSPSKVAYCRFFWVVFLIPKSVRSAQTHKSTRFIWIIWSTICIGFSTTSFWKIVNEKKE